MCRYKFIPNLWCRDDRNGDSVSVQVEQRVLKTNGEWINVEDKLPEEYGLYLISNIDSGNVRECTYDPNRSWQGLKVTHWMNLPEPPKA